MKLLGWGSLGSSLALALAGQASAQQVTIGSDVNTNRSLTITFFDPLGQSFTAVTDTLTSFGFEFTSLNPDRVNAQITFSLLAGETLSGTPLFSTNFTVPTSVNSRDVQQFVDLALPNISVLRGSRYTGVITTSSERNALLLGPTSNPQTGQPVGGDNYLGGRLLSAVPTGFANCVGPASNCDANFRVTGNLTTAAVPEPSTWAMLMLGFAGAGAMLRRRAQPASRRVRYNFAF